jgi:rhodanese-related sulfurtransferase
MSQHLFAFALVIVALGAFVMVSIVENRVNGVAKKPFRFNRYYAGLASAGLLIALSAFMFPERKAALQQLVADENVVRTYPLDTMAVDELAFRLVNEDRSLQIIDFRPPVEYAKLSLPGSTSFTVDNLFEKEPNQMLTLRHRTTVFLADDEVTERRCAIMAAELGYQNIRILRGGFAGFQAQILNFTHAEEPGHRNEDQTIRFREHARQVLPGLIQKNTSAGPVKKTQKRVLGGC